ncbi:MAG: hypothetical protein PHH77_09925 [Victivallaceae bacterium]|nr:hypothetical protein [Victivallaceae bacterium]
MMFAAARIKIEPHDRGPLYRETDMARLPVEPWSTYSNLVFLAIFVYFAVKTRFSYRKYPLFTVFLPLLFLGWLGGTVYHATRSHNFWLLLDYLPIMFMILIASIYFWRELVGNWLLVFAFTLLPVMLYRLIYAFAGPPHSISISIGYSLMALIVIVPLVLHCALRNPHSWKLLAGALASFIAAIGFRVLDDHSQISFLPMGTHFLWHLFGGLSSFFGLSYLYDSDGTGKRADKQFKNKKIIFLFLKTVMIFAFD